MAPSNLAVIRPAKGTPLKVQPSTYTAPGQNEIVVKNAAVAINPYDWIIQDARGLAVSWVKLPFALQIDIAREVVEVKGRIGRFKGMNILGIIFPYPNVPRVLGDSEFFLSECPRN